MTDLEKQLVRDFVSNKEMFQAVKTAFALALTESDYIDPRVSEFGRKRLNLSNEELGANLRAKVEALSSLEVVFGTLVSCKTPQLTTPLTNPAR